MGIPEVDYGDGLREFPHVDPLLVAKLEEHFPDRAAGMSASRDEERVRVGQVSVVRFLREVCEMQSQNILREK